jgi:hypothetical protein
MSRLYSDVIGDHKTALLKLLEINELASEPLEKMKLSIAIVTENIYAGVVHHVRTEVLRIVSSKGASIYRNRDGFPIA